MSVGIDTRGRTSNAFLDGGVFAGGIAETVVVVFCAAPEGCGKTPTNSCASVFASATGVVALLEGEEGGDERSD